MILTESTKSERVAYLTRLLITSRELKTDDMAQQMGVAQRTIQRDLNEISRVIPIHFDNGSWFYIDQSEQISPY